jgi:toxin YoeB
VRKVTLAPGVIEQMQNYKAGQQKLAFKIFELLADIQNNPFQGKGKPEPLKGDLSGFWSRRIDQEHRLIYKIEGDEIQVLSCFGHYQ